MINKTGRRFLTNLQLSHEHSAERFPLFITLPRYVVGKCVTLVYDRQTYLEYNTNPIAWQPLATIWQPHGMPQKPPGFHLPHLKNNITATTKPYPTAWNYKVNHVT